CVSISAPWKRGSNAHEAKVSYYQTVMLLALPPSPCRAQPATGRSMPGTRSFDAIVIGAGAAGMFCAALAGQRGRRALLVDNSPEPGRKILISGGGRCNFTNIGATADNFLSANPHFAKSALGRFTPADFIALVDRHRIAWHEKTLGQLFCDGSSEQIGAVPLDECAAGAVDTAFGEAPAVEHRDGAFRVSFGKDSAEAPSLVIA